MTVALFRERKTLLESLKKNMHFLLKKWDIYSDLDWMAHELFLKKKSIFSFLTVFASIEKIKKT